MSTANFWSDRFIFYCLNGHTYVDPDTKKEELDPIELQPEMKGQAYVCPKYYPYSNDNPEGMQMGEVQCRNRISFKQAEKVVNHFEKIEMESIDNGEIIDFTNYKFAIGSIEGKVLLLDENKVYHIGLLDQNVNHTKK